MPDQPDNAPSALLPVTLLPALPSAALSLPALLPSTQLHPLTSSTQLSALSPSTELVTLPSTQSTFKDSVPLSTVVIAKKVMKKKLTMIVTIKITFQQMHTLKIV